MALVRGACLFGRFSCLTNLKIGATLLIKLEMIDFKCTVFNLIRERPTIISYKNCALCNRLV